MNLWFVGTYTGEFVAESGKRFVCSSFSGVFDSEEDAVKACRDHTYFVGPLVLNEQTPHEPHEWPGSWYPIRKDEDNGDNS